MKEVIPASLIFHHNVAMPVSDYLFRLIAMPKYPRTLI